MFLGLDRALHPNVCLCFTRQTANLLTGFLLQFLIVNIRTNLHVIEFVEDNINWT